MDHNSLHSLSRSIFLSHTLESLTTISLFCSPFLSLSHTFTHKRTVFRQSDWTYLPKAHPNTQLKQLSQSLSSIRTMTMTHSPKQEQRSLSLYLTCTYPVPPKQAIHFLHKIGTFTLSNHSLSPLIQPRFLEWVRERVFHYVSFFVCGALSENTNDSVFRKPLPNLDNIFSSFGPFFIERRRLKKSRRRKRRSYRVGKNVTWRRVVIVIFVVVESDVTTKLLNCRPRLDSGEIRLRLVWHSSPQSYGTRSVLELLQTFTYEGEWNKRKKYFASKSLKSRFFRRIVVGKVYSPPLKRSWFYEKLIFNFVNQFKTSEQLTVLSDLYLSTYRGTRLHAKQENSTERAQIWRKSWSRWRSNRRTNKSPFQI